jgi:hypothetical protein
MPDRFPLAAAKTACVLLAAALTGCACSCPRCAPTSSFGWQATCGPTAPCHGYFSTCWRSWPPECAPCPSFATAAMAPEALPLPALPQRTTSPEEKSDVPAPEPPAAPTNALPGFEAPFSPTEPDKPQESARLPRRTNGSNPIPVSFIPARLDSR